ncbi:MAG: long-chain fatty acid--CoA ligase, partial [Actinobacteria bacterium]|nr:long-chain fatty acid--CoA ligase [Actinomycetota bacterium]
QRVKAFIVLRPGAAATEDDIIEHCRDHLARFKVPKFVEFRETLPKTFVGKVLRRELTAEEEHRLQAAEGG